MKVALVYDRVNKIGGAERVLAALHEIYPEAPLYTAVYHPGNAPWAKGWEVRPSFVDHFPLASSTHELYPWLMPLAFESFEFTKFNVVITVTSAEAKGIITKPETLHLCYCLTPTRYLWIDSEIYQKSIPALLRPLSKPFFSYLRTWDKIASQRPDEIIAISKTVQTRIKAQYNRDSSLIYPPVAVDRFNTKRQKGKSPMETDYFLVVSRLVPYKRVDLAIRACNRLRLPLVVVGKGLEARRLKTQAGPTIKFVAELTEEQLVLYYQRCRALIFPQEEDFGIAVVEAQAAGKPVIAFKKGGATEIIRTGKTGIFFSRQTEDSLIQAIRRFESTRFSESECKKNAQRFSKNEFIKSFSQKVEAAWRQHQNHFQ